MSESDRQKWNAKYKDIATGALNPSQVVISVSHLLPCRGDALDLAGGSGRHAVWLAQRGLNVTLADISDIGLEIAQHHAAQTSVRLHTIQIDFENEPFPTGPWDLIVSVCFLLRDLLKQCPATLKPGGTLLVLQPTKSNLERFEKPPERFLLNDGELQTLVGGLQIVHYEEGWLADGRHDALLVARKPDN